MTTSTQPWIESNHIPAQRWPRRIVEQVDLIRKAVLERSGMTDVLSFVPDDHGHATIEFWLYILHFNPSTTELREPGNVVRDPTGKGIKLELTDGVFLIIYPEYIEGEIAQYFVKVEGPREQKPFIREVYRNLFSDSVAFSG